MSLSDISFYLGWFVIISYCHKRPLRPVACLELSQKGLHGIVENSLNPETRWT